MTVISVKDWMNANTIEEKRALMNKSEQAKEKRTMKVIVNYPENENLKKAIEQKLSTDFPGISIVNNNECTLCFHCDSNKAWIESKTKFGKENSSTKGLDWFDEESMRLLKRCMGHIHTKKCDKC